MGSRPSAACLPDDAYPRGAAMRRELHDLTARRAWAEEAVGWASAGHRPRSASAGARWPFVLRAEAP